MKSIVEELIADMKPPRDPPRQVAMGLHWTAVRSRKGTGMSHTYKSDDKAAVSHGGRLESLTMDRLCGMALSGNTLDASVGIAALNSLWEPNGRKGNINSVFLRMARGKTVSVIGRFPTNDAVRKVAGKCYILEMDPRGDEYPAEACDDILPRCDVNLITATTLINHTLDRLLELGSGGFNIVLGPSTPFHPIMFERGADILAGVRVVDRKALFSSIIQGVKKFKSIGGVEPVYLRRS